jgi:hypothetical protein
MVMRTTERTVKFSRQFSLSTIPGLQPPGLYRIVTDEEPIDSASRLAYRRVATTMEVRRDGAVQTFPIEPAELEAGLLADAGLTVSPGGRR